MTNGIITEFDSKEVTKVRMRFGAEGYLAYVAVQELLYRNKDHVLERNYDSIAAEICVSANVVKGVVEELDLFVMTDTHFTSTDINMYFESKRKLSEAKARGGYARWGKKKEADAYMEEANGCLEYAYVLEQQANANDSTANANKGCANAQEDKANAQNDKRKEAKENSLFLSVLEKTDECEDTHAHAKADPIDWKWIREQLVIIFQGTRIPKPNSNFSEGRKNHIRARISEVGIDGFLVVMKRAANSTFLSKTCEFNISLTWLVNPQNFEKISEGVYDDKPSEIQNYISERTSEYQINWDSVVSWYNNCGLVPIVTLTDDRKYLFLKAYEQVDGDKAKKGEALKRFKNEVKASDYLQGKSQNSKKRDFDWCFDRMNYLRILEGTYNNEIYNKNEVQYGKNRDSRGGTSAPDPKDADSYYVTEGL